jgi:hypothetical protein
MAMIIERAVDWERLAVKATAPQAFGRQVRQSIPQWQRLPGKASIEG